MKTLVTLFVCFLTGIGTLSGQSVQAGPQGGFNFSYFTGENAGRWILKPGVHFGGYLKYPLGKKLNLRSEVLLVNKGGILESDTLDFRENMYYVDVPLLLEWQPDEDFFKVYIGFQGSYLVDAYGIREGGRIESDSLYKRYSFGINGGLGYRFDSGLEIGVRVTKDLISPYDMSAVRRITGLNFSKIDSRIFNILFTVNYPLVR